MTKESYKTRLNSPEWKAFSKKCRSSVRDICQMCGRHSSRSCVHHMRYDRIDTDNERLDVVVLCHTCHDVYHDSCKHHPRTLKSRKELLFELADVLNAAGVATPYFRTNGKEMHDKWLLGESLSSGPKSKIDSLRKIERSERKRVARLEKSKGGHVKVAARCAIDPIYAAKKEAQRLNHKAKKAAIFTTDQT